MNKRIVLIDQVETPNYARYYGSGLGGNIFTLQYLDSLPKNQKDDILNLGLGDATLLVGSGPFKYLREYYHFGIRNENYSDCAKLRRLSIEGGSFVKCVTEFPSADTIQDFMSPEFTVHRDFSWFKQKVLHTFDEVCTFLNWIDCLPQDEPLGFDYEASGMALDKWFELSGASLCNNFYGGFISFTDLRRNSTKEQYEKVLDILRKVLKERMSNIWVFNQLYEFQVSHRVLKFVDLYDLCDAGIINVLDGNHLLKKYSLKWTAQNVIEATVWDTDFDRLEELLDSMYFSTVGKTKKDREKVLKVTPDTYKDTPEWNEICSRYPNYIQEFELLISEYWGCPFMNIPSEILGYYCNLDAFYTLQIYLARKDVYSKEAFQTFLDNSRLGARLHASGLYIDEPYRLKYQKECHRLMAWGITYTATARCRIKMDKHSKLMANVKKYNKASRVLLEKNSFFNGDSLEITKFLLTENIDSFDSYDTGIDEGKLLMTYGQEFAENFMDIVRSSMEETKFKGKIDKGVSRKKKILGIISEKLSTLLELDKLKTAKKQAGLIELEKYLYYERAYNELCNISKTQLYDINNIPDEISGFGQVFNLLDYSTYISNNYFKCKSHIENDLIVSEMFELYKNETSFIAALSESIQQLPGENKDNFYKDLGITTIEDAFSHFMREWEKYFNGNAESVYPNKVFDLAIMFWRGGIEVETAKDVHPVKDVWADFIGYSTQAQFFKEFNNQCVSYGAPFQEQDLSKNFFFMRKFTINYLLYKKYSKVLSTYIDGMFKANNKWVIEGEDHIPLREADPGEPGAVEKCFVHYEVNTKSSKRWSSGFHTIISHSDLKDCIIPPYHYDEFGNRIDEGFVETYFDINIKISVT